MGAKPIRNIKTEMGTWNRVKEAARELEGEQNHLLYESEHEIVCEKSNYPVVLASVGAD